MSYHTVGATESGVTNIGQLNFDKESNTRMQNPGIMQANKISPATVSSWYFIWKNKKIEWYIIMKVCWLMENYEKAEGVSLLRSTIYDNYLTHCSETKFDPLNAPSFGKLIRSVFTGLQTRRLGTRYGAIFYYIM